MDRIQYYSHESIQALSAGRGTFSGSFEHHSGPDSGEVNKHVNKNPGLCLWHSIKIYTMR